MNIAFTTIIIFIILAPGFLSRIAYNSSKLSIYNSNKNIVNELTFSIIPAILFQIFGVFVINNLTSYYIDFELLGNLIMGNSKPQDIKNNFCLIDKYKYPIFFYNLLIFSFAFLTGYLLRKLVRKCKLDRKIRYLRFSNKWHYIFTGECLDFPDVPDQFEDINEKIVNVLCKVNGKNILYTGTLFNYYINNTGDLEAIHLKYPIRRMLDDDNVTGDSEKYYVIESRYLVIPNNDIINLNFRYFNLVEIDENTLTIEERKNIISEEG